MTFIDQLELGVSKISESDPIITSLASRFGLPTIRPHSDYYQELVSSIISQQLSVKAASTIQHRFVALFGTDKIPEPGLILGKTVEDLRGCGLSRGKAMYIQDLALHVLDGKIHFDEFTKLSNDEIISELTAVKGIGEWTAHMFLMFCMGRLDVLAIGDLGLKNGITKLYGLSTQATAEDVRVIALKNKWHPYETIACWYVWKSLDNSPK